MTKKNKYTALILAGERQGKGQGIGQYSKLECKALIPVAGKPMILRVLEALESSGSVDSAWLCGPDSDTCRESELLQDLITSKRINWFPPQKGPSLSVSRVAESLPLENPVLITTADHALLCSDVIDYFCTRADSLDSGLNIGLARYSLVKNYYPEVERTLWKFREGDFCTCNLFIASKEAIKSVGDFWVQIENMRKKPWKIARYFSFWAMLKYISGRLYLSEAMEIASSILKVGVEHIELPFPESAIDVDTQEDLKMAESIAQNC